MGDRKTQIEKNLDLLLRAVKDPHFTQRPTNAPPTLIALSRAVLALADEVWPQQTLEPERDKEPDMAEKTPNVLPTIGRHVHYVSHGSADGTYPSVCRVAIVTEVKDMVEDGYGGRDPNTDRVSLCVLNPTGMFFSQDLPHADAREMKGGTWHWPCEQREVKVEDEQVMIVAQGKALTLGTDEGMGPVEPYREGQDERTRTLAREAFERGRQANRERREDLPLGQLAHGRFEGRKTGEVRFVHHGRMLAVVFGLEYGRGPITIEVQDIGPAEEGS